MAWILFTETHVKDRMSARELDVYEAVSRAEYPDDGGPAEVPADAPLRMPGVIKQVCDRFRFSILSNPNVSALGPDGTLPEGLIYSAAVIARDSLIALPPTEEGMTNPRQKEHDAAEKELRDIRTAPAAPFAIETPSPITSSSIGGDRLNYW